MEEKDKEIKLFYACFEWYYKKSIKVVENIHLKEKIGVFFFFMLLFCYYYCYCPHFFSHHFLMVIYNKH
jgi:hypothetical protein